MHACDRQMDRISIARLCIALPAVQSHGKYGLSFLEWCPCSSMSINKQYCAPVWQTYSSVLSVAALASGVVMRGITLVCCQYVTKESSPSKTNDVNINNCSLKLEFRQKIQSCDALRLVVDKSSDWLHASWCQPNCLGMFCCSIIHSIIILFHVPPAGITPCGSGASKSVNVYVSQTKSGLSCSFRFFC